MLRVLRYLALTLAVGFALLGCCSTPPPATPVKSADRPSVAALRSTTILLRSGSERTACAGVFVAPKQMVTAAHCLGSITRTALDELLDELAPSLGIEPVFIGRELRFVTYADWYASGGRQKSAAQSTGRVVAVDDESDVALIATDQPSPYWVTVRASEPRWDEPVFTIGHPGSTLVFTISRGVVSYPSRRTEDSTATFTQAGIDVWYGNSGGGLFDEQGRLVGVCSFGIADGVELNFFAHVDSIRKLIGAA